MQIARDFEDPVRAGRIPRHGWAKNSQGVKLLRLPILRLVHEANEIRQANGLPDALSWGQWSEIRSFDQITTHFCLTLRELAKSIRLGSDPCLESVDDQERNAAYEATSLIPLYIDLAFLYARRLADHFARASRYVLFKYPGSAPQDYKSLRPLVAEPARLQRLKPFCDTTILQEAFERHSGWLDKLRDSKDENGQLQKGIRDIMEHHPIAVNIHHSRLGDGPWEVIADLGQRGINASYRPDLIPTLKTVVTDMAAFWTLVCEAARLTPATQSWGAPYGDVFPLTGNDDDVTAFWPESLA